MSRRAIINLVRVGALSSTEDANYASGAVGVSDHDEALLLDIFGDPCANPQLAGEENKGIVHDYADGSEGITPVVTAKTVAIAVDFLGNDLFQKLTRWKAEDAEVYYNPGFGRRTEFAWRPLETTGTDITDLTGKYTLTIAGDATRDIVWDNYTGLRVMRDGFSGKQRILRTPGGAGQLFEGATTNLFAIDTPASGSLGWTAGGSGITTAYLANGFGHADCPHSCRVTGTAATSARSIYSDALPASVTGAGTLNVGMMVKGRFPTGARIGCYASTGGTNLDGEYGDWTWVAAQFIDTLFVANEPYIYIDLTTAAAGESFDFEVGPRTAVFRASSSQYATSDPQWMAQGAARTADSLTSTAALAWPRNGSMMSSFYAPADFDDTIDSQWIGLCNPASGATGELSLIAYNGNTRLRATFYFDAGGTKYVVGYADAGKIIPGAVNTMAATWSGKDVYLYLNGALLSSSTVAANADRAFGAVAVKIGGIGSGPFLLNTLRIEREPWSADRVLQEHITATDPRSLGTSVACRGRRFKIVGLPTTQRQTGDGSCWSGNIVLRQVGYTSAFADIVSKEVL